MSPVTLILAGLVLGLYCGAVNSLLALFHYDQLQGMFLWGTGALNQQDWSAVQFILPRLLVAGLLAALLLRPLTLLGLDDGVARNPGWGCRWRASAPQGLAIIFSAMLVSAVGVIGFIGLFAPLMAKDAGRAPHGAPHDAGAVAGGAAAVVDRSGDDRGDAGVA